MAAWVVNLMNEVLHPSAFSLGRLGAPALNERNNWEWRFGSTPEWLPYSLHAAFWTYHQTIGLMVDRYSDEAAATAAATDFADGNRDFQQASQWESTGRLGQLPAPLIPAILDADV